MAEAAYDRMGIGYGAVRRPDPRIAAQIEAALGDARSVLNVGAGAGSYEPADREVTAVEPSRTMIEQRPAGAAPVVEAFAEQLPFADDSTDGFWLAVWDRPEMHLDPNVRRASSSWHHMDRDEIDHGLEELEADIASGRWDDRNGHLRTQPELDIGLRLVIAELPRG